MLSCILGNRPALGTNLSSYPLYAAHQDYCAKASAYMNINPLIMSSMVLERPHEMLRKMELPVPRPGPKQVLLQIHACGVCRTDLHVVDGELTQPKLPLIPGHEIVGTIVERGAEATRFVVGDKVGVPWLGYTCGHCRYCLAGRENLCDFARFTGYQIDGGYAEYALADERFVFSLPSGFSDAEAAPLLCAGLIGYRSLVAAGDARRVGLYGFGAAAHIITQVACHQGQEVFAFTKPDDLDGQNFARQLGAAWAGDSNVMPPVELDAAILFAPVGSLVPQALKAVSKGGTVVCAGIHMSDIPSFPYRLLWGERKLRSVANLTRKDGEEFLALAPKVPVQTTVQTFPLEQANEALDQVRTGKIRGAAVLVTAGN
jgi:alcohol dehydrogenase, propanol-preferring